MNKVEVGELAEEIVIKYELSRLKLSRGNFYLKKVSENASLGYDIESIENIKSKSPIFIEVKACKKDLSFILTINEINKLKLLGESAYIYLVNIENSRVEKVIKNPMGLQDGELMLNLQPVRFKAKLI